MSKRLLILFTILASLAVEVKLFVTFASSTMFVFFLQFFTFGIAGLAFYKFAYPKLETKKEFGSLLGIRAKRALDFVVLGFLISAAISLHNSVYTKNLFYYLSTSLAAGLLCLQIICHDEQDKSRMSIVLIQLLLLASTTGLSSFLINPYLTGQDAYRHADTIQMTLASGHVQLPEYEHYQFYPLALILPSIVFQVTEFDLRGAMELTKFSLYILVIPLIFLIGRKMMGDKLGLMSSLLVAISPLYVASSNHYMPMAIGATFILIDLYILVTQDTHFSRKILAVFGISALAVFFTHAVSSLVLMLILGANFLGVRLLRATGNPVSKRVTFFVAYAIGLVAYWIFIYSVFFKNMIRIMFLIETLPPITQTFSRSPNPYLYTEMTLNYLGITAMVFFVVVGLLCWLRNRAHTSVGRITIIISLGLLLIVPSFSVAVNSFAEPERMLSFITLLWVFPATVGLFSTLSLGSFSKSLTKGIVSLALVSIIAFASFASYLTWDNNGILTTQIPTYLNHVEESALVAGSYIQKIPKGNMIYMTFPTHYLAHPERGFTVIIGYGLGQLSSMTVNNTGYFFVSIPNLKSGTFSGNKTIKYDESFLQEFTNHDLWYDNGAIRFYENKFYVALWNASE